MVRRHNAVEIHQNPPLLLRIEHSPRKVPNFLLSLALSTSKISIGYPLEPKSPPRKFLVSSKITFLLTASSPKCSHGWPSNGEVEAIGFENGMKERVSKLLNYKIILFTQ